MHLSKNLLLLGILIFVKIKKEMNIFLLNLGLQVPKALVLLVNGIYTENIGLVLHVHVVRETLCGLLHAHCPFNLNIVSCYHL